MPQTWFIQKFWTLLGLCTVSVCGWIVWSAAQGLRAPPDSQAERFVGSAACADCHEDRHASWFKTFHRTMTQDAAPATVQGLFNGQALDAFGATVFPRREGDQYRFDYVSSDGEALASIPVARTVGSHRYQQYLSKDPDSETYYRLHYLWHNGDQRWVHMNAAFLGTDAQPFDAQVTTWNNNCVFCHNTGPAPQVNNLQAVRDRAQRGEAFDATRSLIYDTEVAELGISCETCHGPASVHVERMGVLSQRWVAKVIKHVDGSIVNPDTMSAARANDVCGACHAGRTPKSIADLDQWLTTGQTFRAGEALSDHLQVVDAHTPSPSAEQPDLFRNRFWPDGSIRLSAYEYQANAAAACSKETPLVCVDCHTMHGGDPAGMLPARGRDDTNCVRCHQAIGADVVAHSGHAAESSGARCMNCHMPKAVYGVMTIHRTHQVALPDITADLAAGKPNACLNCHASKAPGDLVALSADAGRYDGASLALADGLASLLAGDPVRQAVAAYSLGQVDWAPPDELLVRVPWLIAALQDDRPAIRRFSAQSLQAIDARLATSSNALGLAPALGSFDFTAPDSRRTAQRQAIENAFEALQKSTWPAPNSATGLDANYRLQPDVLQTLLALGAQTDKQIDIGE